MDTQRGEFSYTADELLAKAQAHLDQDVDASLTEFALPSARGDHDLNPGSEPNPVRAAAVLVPIIAYDNQTTVLLTQRSKDLPSHPGQVAFPGGKIDETDASAVAAALRETHEETGIASSFVDVAGFLDVYQTGTGYRVLPVVGIVKPGFDVRPEPGEVDEVFEVPLEFLMDPRNHKTHSGEWRGVRRYYYAIPYDKYYIWGATAGMLRNLYDRVYRR